MEEAYILWEKRDVGRAQDFTNQKINKWTILYRTVDPKDLCGQGDVSVEIMVN